MLSTTIVMWSIAPSFPAGGVGLGLLLLRASVAAALLTSIAFAPSGEVMQAVFVLIGLAILSGSKTRFFAFVSAGIALYVATKTASMELGAVTTLNALTLALVGPGAYSVDARLRGRRTVVLPDSEAR